MALKHWAVLLLAVSRRVGAQDCPNYCANWCVEGVTACHLLECDPTNPDACPGSTCEKVCGPIQFSASSSDKEDSIPWIEIVCVILALVLCASCVVTSSWYLTSERPQERKARSAAADLEAGNAEPGARVWGDAAAQAPLHYPPPIAGWADDENASVYTATVPMCRFCGGAACKCRRGKSSPSVSGTRTPASGTRSGARTPASGTRTPVSGHRSLASSPAPASRHTTPPSQERPSPATSRSQSRPRSRDETDSLPSVASKYRTEYLRRAEEYAAAHADVLPEAPSRSGARGRLPDGGHRRRKEFVNTFKALTEEDLAAVSASLELIRIAREREEQQAAAQ